MRVRIEAPLAALVVMAPASAFAVDYLSADQAAHMMFPQAERFEPRTLQFDAAQMQALAGQDRKSTRLNSSHIPLSRMPSSA